MRSDTGHEDIEKLLQEAAGVTTRSPDLRRIHRRGRARMWTTWVGASGATLALIALFATLVTGILTPREGPNRPAGRSTIGPDSLKGRLLFAAVEAAEDPDNPPPMQFYSVDPDGGNRRQILQDVPAEGWSGAALSPDGTKLVFPLSPARNDNPEIFIANADGTGLRQLTHDGRVHLSPSWSPDGTRIVFVRAGENGTGSALWVMNADGTDATKLVESQNYLGAPSFSPDGNKVLYDDVVEGTFLDLFVVDAATREITRLTKSPWPDLNPSWSPDASKIAFERNVGDDPEGGDVYVMDSDGGRVSELVEDAGSPVWSPDGRYIAVTRHGSADVDSRSIFVVNAEGGMPKPVPGGYDFLRILEWRES